MLNYVCNISKDLTSISDIKLSLSTEIEIDELTEYLEELSNRKYINIYENGSYITLQGRMAIENSKKWKTLQRRN